METSFLLSKNISPLVCGGTFTHASRIFYGIPTRASPLQARTPSTNYSRFTTFDTTASFHYVRQSGMSGQRPSSTTISLIFCRLKNTQKTTQQFLLVVYTYQDTPRNGSHKLRLLIPSLLPLTTMIQLLQHVHPCSLQTVMIPPSQLPPAKTQSFNLRMMVFCDLQVKPLFLPSWNRSTNISSRNGIPVLSSSHQPTSTPPRHTFLILSLFYVKRSIKVTWPMEQLNNGCSLS